MIIQLMRWQEQSLNVVVKILNNMLSTSPLTKLTPSQNGL